MNVNSGAYITRFEEVIIEKSDNAIMVKSCYVFVAQFYTIFN